MSAVAGRMSIQAGAHCLEKHQGGRGLLIGGAPSVNPGNVLILGGGVVGENAATIATGMEAKVHIVDKSEARLKQLVQMFGDKIIPEQSDKTDLNKLIAEADLLIGGVLIPGAEAPKLVTKDMLKLMKRGSVIVDVAIDQGGCVEGVTPNTHSDPFEIRNGVIVSAIANLPGAVPRTSSIELSTNLQKYVDYLLVENWFDEYKNNESLRPSLQIHNGLLLSEEVADSLSLTLSKLV